MVNADTKTTKRANTQMVIVRTSCGIIFLADASLRKFDKDMRSKYIKNNKRPIAPKTILNFGDFVEGFW
jgi:hypothetical protein